MLAIRSKYLITFRYDIRKHLWLKKKKRFIYIEALPLLSTKFPHLLLLQIHQHLVLRWFSQLLNWPPCFCPYIWNPSPQGDHYKTIQLMLSPSMKQSNVVQTRYKHGIIADIPAPLLPCSLCSRNRFLFSLLPMILVFSLVSLAPSVTNSAYHFVLNPKAPSSPSLSTQIKHMTYPICHFPTIPFITEMFTLWN